MTSLKTEHTRPQSFLLWESQYSSEMRQEMTLQQSSSKETSVSGIALFRENDPEKNQHKEASADYASIVVEYIVPVSKAKQFQAWYEKLLTTAKQTSGFLRADMPQPLACKNDVHKWHAVAHFDTPDSLNRWLRSKARDAIYQLGKETFETYRFKSFSTGAEGWFSPRSGAEIGGLAPPAWKEILTVVLALYPIILIQECVFDYFHLFENWSPETALMTNLVISSCILTFLVMPLTTQLLNFWLRPAHKSPSLKVDLIGTVSTVTAMVGMVFVFNLV